MTTEGHEGQNLGIITKGNLILRDLDLLRQIGQKNRLMVNLTITTLNVKLARILELATEQRQRKTAI